MKKLFTIIIGLMSAVGTYADSKHVNVETAGTFKDLIEDIVLDESDTLVISGLLNGTDIRYLRWKLGGDNWGLLSENPYTEFASKIDLSDSRIVEGGDGYIEIPTSSSRQQVYTQNDTLGYLMFNFCDALEYIVLPKDIKYLDSNIFTESPNLKVVRIIETTPPETNEWSLYGTEILTLVVPNGCREAYVSDPNWNTFGTIVEEDSYLGIDDTVVRSTSSTTSAAYSISGIRANNDGNLPKGIYIKDGKKFVVR